VIDKKSWEESIGRVYRTRDGGEVRIVAVQDYVSGLLKQNLPPDLHFAWDFTGRNIGINPDQDLDLVELVRHTNHSTRDSKCG
jgi:hypothetical protein